MRARAQADKTHPKIKPQPQETRFRRSYLVSDSRIAPDL
jgi:hypothetical protein